MQSIQGSNYLKLIAVFGCAMSFARAGTINTSTICIGSYLDSTTGNDILDTTVTNPTSCSIRGVFSTERASSSYYEDPSDGSINIAMSTSSGPEGDGPASAMASLTWAPPHSIGGGPGMPVNYNWVVEGEAVGGNSIGYSTLTVKIDGRQIWEISAQTSGNLYTGHSSGSLQFELLAGDTLTVTSFTDSQGSGSIGLEGTPAVPEPATLGTFSAALIALGVWRRKRRFRSDVRMDS